MSESEVTSGQRGDWRWLCAIGPSSNLPTVCSAIPEIVAGRYVVVTSFDRGELELSEADRSTGWSKVGKAAVSPEVGHVRSVPSAGWDEWYVADGGDAARQLAPDLVGQEVFVNYGRFYLGVRAFVPARRRDPPAR